MGSLAAFAGRSRTSSRNMTNLDGQLSYRQEQETALVSALQSCLNSLGVQIPKALRQLMDCPLGCSRLCEMLVDLLEAAELDDERACTVVIQSFLDELHG